MRHFQIILAFGNYMNSNKKAYAQGFKIESLAKVSAATAVQNYCNHACGAFGQ